MAEPGWRETVPEASADDLETLLGTGIGTAREQLEQHGGFLPFALALLNDGEVRLLVLAPDSADSADSDSPTPDPADSDSPTPISPTAEAVTVAEFDADAMLNDLTELLRQNRGECRAAALVCDITLPDEGTDAIHVAAEHKDGSVFAAVLPYGRQVLPHGQQPGAQWEFGELAADANEAVVWVG